MSYASCLSISNTFLSLTSYHYVPLLMSDSSPPIRRRKPLPAPPVVNPSPSPVRKTRRQMALNCRYLDHQAKQGESGISVLGFGFRALYSHSNTCCACDSEDCSSNSEDDGDAPDLSYVTDGSYSDASFSIYAQGMSSQGGFPTPMNQKRYFSPLQHINRFLHH